MTSKILAEHQYKLEKRLARRLMSSSREERRGLYAEVYEEYYDTMKSLEGTNQAEDEGVKSNRLKMILLRPLLDKSTVFLEIGGGNFALMNEIAPLIKKMISVEACEIPLKCKVPKNTDMHISDSTPYPVAGESVDIVFSSHLVEHLHPDDLPHHLSEVKRVLKKGGTYVCITPNKLYGPHDISGMFHHKTSCGLHLKEYSYLSLTRLLRSQHFSRIASIYRLDRRPRSIFLQAKIIVEYLVSRISGENLKWVLEHCFPRAIKPFRPLEQVVIMATK